MPRPTQPGSVSVRSRADRLINLDSFYTHVRRCRWAFAAGLAVAVVGQVMRMPNMGMVWKRIVSFPTESGGDWWTEEEVPWVVSSLLLAAATITFFSSSRGSVLPLPPGVACEVASRASETTPLLPNNSLNQSAAITFGSFDSHSRHTTILFVLSFLVLILRPVPSLLYILKTHQAPPKLPFSEHSHQSLVRIVGNVGVWAMFIAIGLVRRGPEMRYDPPKLGTGFGLKAGVYDVQEDQGQGDAGDTLPYSGEAEDVAGKTREVSNVFDYDGCCLLNFVFVGYALHIGFLCAKKDKLEISDLPHLTYSQRAENIVLPIEGRVFLPEAHSPATTRFPSDSPEHIKGTSKHVGSWELARILWQGKRKHIVTIVLFEWAKVVAGFIPPYCLHEIIQSFDDQRSKQDKAYPLLMCAGLFVGMFSETLLASYVGVDEVVEGHFFRCYQHRVAEHVKLHLPVRAMLNVSLFSKILRSVDAKAAEAEGGVAGKGNSQGRAQILNLLLIDGERVGGLGYRAFLVSNAVLSLVIGVTFLYMMFGWATFVGMAVIPLAAPVSYLISVYRYRCDRELSRARDARTSAINEFLLSVKVIKLNAWDEHFVKRISVLRDKEIRLQRRRYHIGTGFNIIADQVPLVAILVIFFTYTKIMKATLEPAQAMVGMVVFFGKVKSALSLIPDVVSDLLLARISLDRLSRYFGKPEVTAWRQGTSTSGQIQLQQATIGWPSVRDPEEEQVDEFTEEVAFKLYNMNAILPPNALTLVSGRLGSGKTLFLLGLLGEARVLSGEIEAPRSRADALPLPEDLVDIELTVERWLDPSMTAYSPQISYIKHGSIRDNILNGLPMWHERYAAVLRQCALLSDLKLFDHADLTEVGEQGVTLVSQLTVISWIYSRSILCHSRGQSGGQKARAKTIYLDDILSAVDAHTARYLCQHCLKGDLLRDRTVVLVSHNVNLVLPLAQYVVHIENGTIDRAGRAEDFIDPFSQSGGEVEAEIQDNLLDATEPLEADALPYSSMPSEIRQIYEEERREIGQVNRRNYAFLFSSAGGVIYWAIFALIYGSTEFFNFLEILWLKYWTADGRPERLGHYLSGYATIVFIGILMGSFRWVWLYGIRFNNIRVGFTDSAAPKIHDLMLRRLVRSPLALFNSWPTGRLLNRFSGDMNQMDGSISDDVGRTVSADVFHFPQFQFKFTSSLSAHSFSELRAELRRLESTVGSPLVTLCNDAINSVAVLRAFGTGRIISQAMSVFTDVDRRTKLSNYIVLTQDISGAQAGFVLSFALNAATGLLGLLERLTFLDQSMVAVERLNEICNLPMEDEDSNAAALPPNWPREGRIQVRGLSVRYSEDMPVVLRDIDVDIEGGRRIALVGPTGSGKSTFALSLFRAVEPQCQQGTISIDGIDIAHIALHDLRSRLTAITQEPLLTSGTLRETLDISGEHNDHDLYDVLKRVNLITGNESVEEKARNPFLDLDSYVAIEGSNFSLGERQLLVLARALLKRSRIIVMDEATSNVDYETDAKITKALQTSVAPGTTLVTIAHRLRTIID
ncbi:hypothetical protein QFC19_000027 [Naganishia cerealis]|uniref:Uncharacterized protein n=1 Tax=Naganishia cerealis TaxID=610337 RepID=A0ACC2WRN7_9TREE|nr:hypothetical protein QFC19_000027 [Naganishia cerealis]